MLFVIFAVVVYFHLFYFVALIKSDFSVIDTAWGMGFVVVTLSLLFQTPVLTSQQILLTTMICAWALRLSLYLHFRNVKKGEDFRYRQWREEWGDKANLIAYFKVFWLQAIILLCVSSIIPILWFSSSEGISPWDYLALLIFCFGLFAEAIADYQMNQFKKNEKNKGQLCLVGLWKYSRHPNYFGEILVWWGVFLLSISNQQWMWAWIGPFLLTLLLLKVSGIPMLEKKYEGRADFEEYKRKTNALILWFPKK